MYFNVRHAEEPELCEHLLDTFEGAEVLVKKQVALVAVALVATWISRPVVAR
jgi:hypothetical protein